VRRVAGLLVGLACTLVLVLPASGFIPRAERVAGAVAKANRTSSRSQALRLELSLRVGDGEPVAEGELVTHPTGLARLELRASGGLVERHLLRGTEHLASRNGKALENPRALLPPIFLLQADSALTLRAALRSFGVRVDYIGLAPCGGRDCFILGDPRRVPPPPGEEQQIPGGPEETGESLESEELLESRSLSAETDAFYPQLWVDVISFEVLRIDPEEGVSIRLGPTKEFEQVRFPQWIVIEEPGLRPVRFDVLRATPVNAPAPAFGRAWLRDRDSAPLPPLEPSPE
jgi:hypothetical protein